MSEESLAPTPTPSLDDYSIEQSRTLSILTAVTGFLSFLGSAWIIVEVVTTRAKMHTTYNRLLLGMSIVEAMASVGYMFNTLPIPAGSYGSEWVFWAFGTVSTCTAQGFFIQLGIIPPFCK